ncbi:MAG: 2-dehydropantoate 2-reductase [Xanthobacteraceae bacterium]
MAAAPANASPSRHAEPHQRIAVIGLGSIGGAVAGCLVAAGRHHVVACTREPIERLTLESPAGTAELPLAALTDPAQVAEPADWVMLCTKTHQTAATAPWLSRLCTPAPRVAVLQNGIGHVERVAPLANGAAVLPAIVYFNGERLAPDRVRMRQGSEQDIAVTDDEAGRSFASLFAGTPLRVLLSREFATLVWRKLLINAVANPITTLTLQRQAVLRRPDVHELCLKILDEAVAVARAEGVAVADDEPARAMATLFTFSGELGTSMYFDRLAGRRLEVEALTGAIVAAGERHGIATPLNSALLTLLRVIDDAIGKD